MRRTRCNWHERAVGILIFVVVFLATTLVGSPRSHDRSIGVQRNSDYPRTSAESHDRGTNIDEHVVREPEEVDFAERPQEFHGEPVETDHDVSTLQKPNVTSCAVVLLTKHPELCDVVEEILEVQALMPHLRRVVTRRLGGRRFNFVYEMVRGKTAFQHLYETVKCMAACIKKFVKFVGTVEGLLGQTTPEPIRLTAPPMMDPFPEMETESDRSYNWWATSVKKDYRDPANPSFIAAHFDPPSSPYTRRALSRNCVSNVMKVDSDVCGTLTKMELLDSILVTPGEAVVDEDPMEDSELPVELDSENLVLGGLLDAVAESLDDAREAASGPITSDGAVKDRGSGDKARSRGRKRLLDGNNDEAAEIFQTPDFKIELVPYDDHRTFGGTDDIWSPENFGIEQNKASQARRGFRADDRSAGLHDEKANQGDQGMSEGTFSKRVHRLLTKDAGAERDRPASTHSSRRLAGNSTSGNTDKGQEKIQNILEVSRNPNTIMSVSVTVASL